MKIKNLTCLMLLGFAGGILTSCDTTNKEPVYTESRSAVVSQLVIPDDPSAEVTAQQKIMYGFTMDLVAGEMLISAPEVKIGGGSAMFRSESIPMTYGIVSGGNKFEFSDGTGTWGSDAVTDLGGYLISGGPMDTNPVLVMEYKVNSNTIKTFASQPLFHGTTVTRYPGKDGVMKEAILSGKDAASYGIVFSNDMKHATAYIYNINFAPEQMPRTLEAVIVENLDVTLTPDGYVVEGTEIIPKVREGGKETPFPMFPFTSYKLRTLGGDLTKVTCEYEVAPTMWGPGITFYGTFNGSIFKTDSTESV